jgi:arylsulfatase
VNKRAARHEPPSCGRRTIYVNDEKVAEGKISHTVPFLFSADETVDVGGDLAMPVTDDYPEGESNKFSGKLNWVRIDLEDDDVSHLEPEENRYHRIMAKQ